MLSLVGLAHALVADLAVPVSVDWFVSTVVDGGHSSGDGGVGHGGGVHGVGNNRSVVGNNWGGVHGVGHGGDGVEGHHGGLADRDGSVGADCGLDLGQALAVVHLRHAGVGRAESLGLDQGPLLAVRRGHGLVRGLKQQIILVQIFF